ncbi:hypothetical protein INR49_012071 [Caranx melampygus]|nr:hypothetical protein INR49_012071 [Caranx melampygus]
MSTFYLLLLLLPLVAAQTYHWGPCPTPKVQPNFNLEQYLGRWYEIEKLPASFERGKCIEANYSIRKDGTIRVLNSQFYPYWVLTTDYSSLSVVYSCTDILRIFHIEYAWILGRSRFLPPETVRYAKNLLTSEGIDLFRMTVTLDGGLVDQATLDGGLVDQDNLTPALVLECQLVLVVVVGVDMKVSSCQVNPVDDHILTTWKLHALALICQLVLVVVVGVDRKASSCQLNPVEDHILAALEAARGEESDAGGGVAEIRVTVNDGPLSSAFLSLHPLAWGSRTVPL